MTRIVAVLRDICTGLYFFLSGVEYAVIIPTLNGFLNYLGAEQYYLGLVVSAFSLSGLISAPIFGRISDKTKTSKMCIIVGNLFEIGGNFMYFASTNKNMALAARLIAGIGAGAASSIYGVITLTTTDEERTRAFSKLFLLREAGLVIGPGFNIFLKSISFNLGPFEVNSFNSPGLLMTAVWIFHTVFTIILYKDPAISSNPREEDLSSSNNYANINSAEATPYVRSFKEEFLRDDVIVCLTANFLGVFSQAAMETALTPMTKIFFGWGGVQNSYLFVGGGVVVLVGFGSLSFLSKWVSDRAMLLYGVVGLVVIYILYTTMFVYLRLRPDQVEASWVFPVFIASVALLTLVLPYAWVSQASLFSKITSKETQAFNQGIRMVSLGIGQILAPVWAASLASLDGLPIMVGVNLALNVTLLLMIICSYDRLRISSDTAQNDASISRSTASDDSMSSIHDESTPLLAT